MKKLVSRISLITIIFILALTTIFTSSVKADSRAGVAVSAAVEGGTFTIGLILPSDAIGAQCNIKVTYSNGATETKSLVYANGMESMGFTNSVDFPAKVAGTTKISVTNIVLSDANGNALEENGSKEEVITIQANPSNENNNNNAGNNQDNNSNGTTNTGNNGNTGSSGQTGNSGGTGTTQTPNNTTSTNNSQGNTNTTYTNTTNINNTQKEEEVVNPTFKDVEETVYATKGCNVRSSCSTKISSNKIGGLVKGQSVKRTGFDSEWSRIIYNGKTAYVATSLLTTEEPKEEEENKVNNENTVSEENTVSKENVIENEIVNESTDLQNEALAKVQEEIGVLPEVGKNIAVYMFSIVSIISLICIMVINYKLRNKSI